MYVICMYLQMKGLERYLLSWNLEWNDIKGPDNKGIKPAVNLLHG